MSEPGKFTPSKQGGWEGRIQTLTLDCKVRLVPNDNRKTDEAPDFIVLLGWSRVGEAWEAKSRSDPPRPYLRIRLHDPTWPAPLRAALFPAPDGLTAELAWSSRLSRERDRHDD